VRCVRSTNKLKIRGASGACIFLANNKCSIHAVKPSQCSTYPFWPRALWSEVDWRAEAAACEGISVEADHSSASSNERKLPRSGAVATESSAGTGSAEHVNQQLNLDHFVRPHAGAVHNDSHVCQEQACLAW
jgi:Putative zinc- or iron-chelating domain